MIRSIVALVVVLAVAGCGGTAPGATPPSLHQARRDLAGGSPALAGLHHQASTILPGGARAIEARLRALRGHPVVVNKWASWCAPCRFEFPVFQRVSVKLGRRVAFLGFVFRDQDASAKRFLARRPLSYPSYSDPRGDIARALRTGEGAPITNFYDRRGKLVFQHAGPYQSDAQLRGDLEKYAPGS